MIQVTYAVGNKIRCANDYIICPGPDSAGGFDVQIKIKNIGTKTIKYVTLFMVPYNAVGDVVACEVRREAERNVRFTGPLASDKTTGGWWNNAWYNTSIKGAVITKAVVEYMDGTVETIPGNTIGQVTGSGSCYVATAVYGSYDCPQVWTLRRYRDYTMAETWYGRAFIRTYYAISPTLVKWFGHTDWFKKMWKGKLDRMVASLNAQGVEDTPYEDRNW